MPRSVQLHSMSSLVLTIPVPDGANAAALYGELTNRLPSLVNSTVRYLAERNIYQDALESKAGLKHFVEELGIKDPVGRALYYVGFGDCEITREIRVGNSLIDRDPRRPVIMRGSIYWLVRHYAKGGYSNTCANGWCERVVERYLRRIKYTCFDATDHHKNMHETYCRLQGKAGFYLSFATFNTPSVSHTGNKFSAPPYDVFIKGRHLWITLEQHRYLRRLQKIIDKTKIVGERMALLREYRQEEAA